MSISRGIIVSVGFGFAYWLLLLLPQQLSDLYHDLCDQVIIPCILGLAIGYFLNCTKKIFILIYSFISLFVCHLLLSIRALVVLYPDLDIGDFLLRSVISIAVIGSIQIFFSVLACLALLKFVIPKLSDF